MEKRMNNLIKQFDLMKFIKANVPLIGLFVIIILVSLIEPNFLTRYNILSVLRQASINGLLAFGLTVVILTGGIDLSVGSTVAFASLVMAKMINSGTNSVWAIIVALIIGAIIGLINGLLITKGKLQAFIATLGTMMVFRGLALYISNGVPESRLGEGLLGWMGRGYFIGIPTPVVILLICFGIFAFFLSKTVFGKRIYAIGGNMKAANLSGINVHRNLIYVYMISGFLAALAGIILTSRVDSAVPTAGTGYELNAIAATVIGGASLTGGRGKATGTLIGILIIAIIINALNLLGISSYLQQLITGVIIVTAVVLDRSKK